MTKNRALAAVVFVSCCVLALPVSAAFRTTVTKAENFPSDLAKIAVVTVECGEVVDCSKIEQKAQLEIGRLAIGLTVVPEVVVRRSLFAHGQTKYTTDLRGVLAEEFELDAILELSIPFAVIGDGYGGQRGSEVKVEMVLVRPDGEVLLHGVGTGRPMNVVTSPERVAGNVVEKLMEKAFR